MYHYLICDKESIQNVISSNKRSILISIALSEDTTKQSLEISDDENDLRLNCYTK